jgi:hypothetical protein
MPVRAPLPASRAGEPRLVVPEPAAGGLEASGDAELDYDEPDYEAPAPVGDYAAARLASEEELDTSDSDEAELLAATDVVRRPGARATEQGSLESDPAADDGYGDPPEPDGPLPIDGVVSTFS